MARLSERVAKVKKVTGAIFPEPTRPVLLCYDGSANASDAIAEARRLLRSRRVLVLHVLESDRLSVGLEAVDREADLENLAAETRFTSPVLTQAKRAALEGVELARGAGFDAEALVHVVSRGAAKEICHIADEREAVAIVVGARGMSPLASLLLGSVSREVMENADRPVLIVPSAAADPGTATSVTP
ncbi:MAG TPA: universal stress protein [Gaiellaceae bacterium]|nr:universal stress protein [Gaiellaceae bacterium]